MYCLISEIGFSYSFVPKHQWCRSYYSHSLPLTYSPICNVCYPCVRPQPGQSSPVSPLCPMPILPYINPPPPLCPILFVSVPDRQKDTCPVFLWSDKLATVFLQFEWILNITLHYSLLAKNNSFYFLTTFNSEKNKMLNRNIRSTLFSASHLNIHVVGWTYICLS